MKSNPFVDWFFPKWADMFVRRTEVAPPIIMALAKHALPDSIQKKTTARTFWLCIFGRSEAKVFLYQVVEIIRDVRDAVALR